MKPTLIIMCGLSASGKSTVAKRLSISYDAIIVSSDDIRSEFGEVQDQSNNIEVFKLFHKRIKENLLKDNNVIADATNITIKSRRQIFETVKNIDCEIIGYLMIKPIEECIDDNICREYPVPHYVIQKQTRNYQIPFYEEGFDCIIFADKYKSEYLDCNFINTCKNKMKGFNQNNPHHNEDLLEHCETVFAELSKRSNNINLLQASMLHDVGKLYTQKTDENRISHYYQHENVGAYYLLSHYQDFIATCFMYKDEILETLFYVNYHMMPMNWSTDKVKDKWKNIFGEEKFNNLILFTECDKFRKEKI